MMDVGSKHEKKDLKIEVYIVVEERDAIISLLKEFFDVFAQTYVNTPGLDTNIVIHRLPLIDRCKSVKQKLRRIRPDILIKVKEEVKKQWDMNFPNVVKYPQWVLNIVAVPKKDNKIRVCADFRDLNRASPKDDFPLP